MGINRYFFDSYAFFEVIKGNKNYLNYLNVVIITTRLNLMELYYWLLRREGKGVAEKYYQKFLPFCIEISDEDIKNACEFRLHYKKKELSYVDCLGYIIAKNHDVRFLTGDRGFENIDNVEYVK